MRSPPSESHPVVVIGAGPHGLAATAHLRSAGVPTVTFGEPMSFWREAMPPGMFLRSSVRASSIDDPERKLTIREWGAAHDRKVPYPIPLEDFLEYGSWFQQQVAPDLDRRQVTSIARSNGGLAVTLADGETLVASRVVVAAGLAPFSYVPPIFKQLPESRVTHTSHTIDLEQFAGRSVIVVGGGQSALEAAALLHEAGSRVEVLVRAPAIYWLGSRGPVSNITGPEVPEPIAPAPQTFRLRHGLYWREAPTDVGGRYMSWVGAAPDVCHVLPTRLRDPLSYSCVKPAAAHWLPDRLRDVPITVGRMIVSAHERDGVVSLELDDRSERRADHVVLGTGYQMDVRRYPFLANELASALRVVGGHPILRRGLQSSVPGLHFIGAPAYWSFGPTMRFVVGTAYTAPAVTQEIVGRRFPVFRWAF
jgi:FAD-dependent urate hydroxylase